MIERHLENPERIRVAAEEEADLEHGLVRVPRLDKLQTLSRLLRSHRGSVIVFGRTKYGVRKLNHDLRKAGHDSADLHGDRWARRPAPPGCWAWLRGDATLVALNLSDAPAAVDGVEGAVLIGTCPERTGSAAAGRLELRPWEGAVVGVSGRPALILI